MAVNFEDLFDFSPQGEPHPDTDDIDFYVEKTAETLFQPAPASTQLNTFSGPDQPNPRLSTSVPKALSASSYTGSSSPGSSSSFGFRTQTQSGDSSAGHFLLDELVGAVASTGDQPKSGEVKGKRGRKPGQRSFSLSSGGSSVGLKSDMKNKLERSRQSARECRARKKLRYQYLDDLILEREKANITLREELLKYQDWCHKLDRGEIPQGLEEAIAKLKQASY